MNRITMRKAVMWAAAGTLCCAWGCDASSSSSSSEGAGGKARGGRPNILFIVWDTVRADYLSLYGYERETTPFLERWAEGARVFDNCVSIASTTVPTHVSMFTGLTPPEHGAHNLSPRISDDFETLAEILGEAGYESYLFSENPKIAARNNITQGFGVIEHPWSSAYEKEALRIAREKVPASDRSTELARNLRKPEVGKFCLKSAGETALTGSLKWLEGRQSDKPYFIFLNYLAAHYPLIPSREHRAALMSPEEVEASYQVDRTAWPFWLYVFGLHEYSAREMELTRLTYAAAVRELDSLLEEMVKTLGEAGYLDNTAVVVVSDHGEHLGEHHLLDHQFSVYEALARVPLVLHYPERVEAGHDSRPVTNLDLYPTLLELAGVERASGGTGISLLRPADDRRRICSYTGVVRKRFAAVQRVKPGFDASAWDRSLCAYYAEPYKFILASNGAHELYRLDVDPGEERNLYGVELETARRLEGELKGLLAGMKKSGAGATTGEGGAIDEEYRKRLEAIGYLDEPEDEEP